MPGNQRGAGYVNEVSHGKLTASMDEFEILLQKNSKYVILEAQKFKGQTFLVVRWDGYDRP